MELFVAIIDIMLRYLSQMPPAQLLFPFQSIQCL